MVSALSDLLAIASNPYGPAREAKRAGRKVVGITPMHFPEELVHASGALPVVLQESDEPVTEGFSHLYPFYCGFTRSNVDLAVKGKLDLFDSIVVSDMCLQTRYMGTVMRHQMRAPFAYIQWPLEMRADRWLEPAVNRLERVRRELDSYLGTSTSDSALLASIDLYDRHRAMLRRVYDLRHDKPGVISGKEMVALVLSGMVMPKEEHLALLTLAFSDLEYRPSHEGIPVFLSGHLCQAVKPDLLDLIESLGGVIVGDDLFTGYRYYGTETPQDANPLRALAKRYLETAVPCPTRADYGQDWAEYVVARSRAAGAAGVVVLVVKFCEPHMIYYPHLKAVLDGAGVPYVMIETEHEVASLEGIRTRLQAFFEMFRR